MLRPISWNQDAHAELASVHANGTRIFAEFNVAGGTWLVPCLSQRGACTTSGWQPLEERIVACDISFGVLPPASAERDRISQQPAVPWAECGDPRPRILVLLGEVNADCTVRQM